MDLNQFNKFVAFCAKQHEGQYRKDGVTPYFSHPARVAILLKTYYPKANYSDLAIAYGHDLIEDCITREILNNYLKSIGVKNEGYISYGIGILSEDKKIQPRDTRKDKYLENIIFFGDNKIWITKLCDRLDNLYDEGMNDDFLKNTYLKESEILVTLLERSLDNEPHKLINQLKKRINELK